MSSLTVHIRTVFRIRSAFFYLVPQANLLLSPVKGTDVMKQSRTVFYCPKLLIKRTLCLLLCLLLLLPLSACGETTALSYGGVIIDEGMYRYWLSYYKYAFLSAADQADDPAFFDQNMPGSDTTWGEYYETQFRENVNALLMGAVLFDQYDLTISDDVQTDIDQYLSGQISRFGSEDALNQALSPMGIDNKKLREILIFVRLLSVCLSPDWHSYSW